MNYFIEPKIVTERPFTRQHGNSRKPPYKIAESLGFERYTVVSPKQSDHTTLSLDEALGLCLWSSGIGNEKSASILEYKSIDLFNLTLGATAQKLGSFPKNTISSMMFGLSGGSLQVTEEATVALQMPSVRELGLDRDDDRIIKTASFMGYLVAAKVQGMTRSGGVTRLEKIVKSAKIDNINGNTLTKAAFVGVGAGVIDIETDCRSFMPAESATDIGSGEELLINDSILKNIKVEISTLRAAIRQARKLKSSSLGGLEAELGSLLERQQTVRDNQLSTYTEDFKRLRGGKLAESRDKYDKYIAGNQEALRKDAEKRAAARVGVKPSKDTTARKKTKSRPPELPRRAKPKTQADKQDLGRTLGVLLPYRRRRALGL